MWRFKPCATAELGRWCFWILGSLRSRFSLAFRSRLRRVDAITRPPAVRAIRHISPRCARRSPDRRSALRRECAKGAVPRKVRQPRRNLRLSLLSPRCVRRNAGLRKSGSAHSNPSWFLLKRDFARQARHQPRRLRQRPLGSEREPGRLYQCRFHDTRGGQFT